MVKTDVRESKITPALQNGSIFRSALQCGFFLRLTKCLAEENFSLQNKTVYLRLYGANSLGGCGLQLCDGFYGILDVFGAMRHVFHR